MIFVTVVNLGRFCMVDDTVVTLLLSRQHFGLRSCGCSVTIHNTPGEGPITVRPSSASAANTTQ